MAASLAGSLAVHYAAGAPVPGSQQLRTSLVSSVTHRKTRIMAAKSNPAAALFSAPSQVLGGNGVSFKRDKTIAAATSVSSLAGLGATTVNTNLTIDNENIATLFAADDPSHVWMGNARLTVKDVAPKHSTEVTHVGSKYGSVAAICYNFSNKYWLYIAWSSIQGDLSDTKMYASILTSIENWDTIKHELDTEGTTKRYDEVAAGFKCLVTYESSKDDDVFLKAVVSKEE